jgi:hypothetical protein
MVKVYSSQDGRMSEELSEVSQQCCCCVKPGLMTLVSAVEDEEFD